MSAHSFITDRAATKFLTESLSPSRHFTTAVRSDAGTPQQSKTVRASVPMMFELCRLGRERLQGRTTRGHSRKACPVLDTGAGIQKPYMQLQTAPIPSISMLSISCARHFLTLHVEQDDT